MKSEPPGLAIAIEREYDDEADEPSKRQRIDDYDAIGVHKENISTPRRFGDVQAGHAAAYDLAWNVVVGALRRYGGFRKETVQPA